LMSSYKPPYTITNKILMSVSNIVELLGELNHIKKELSTPKLRKKNRIKSITGTLQIEGNTFTEEKVTNIINGKTVLGTMREIEEVKGAILAYDYLEKYKYKNEKELLKAHKFLMQNILNNAGTYRHTNVGVGGTEGVTHVAPPPNMIPHLMGELFSWLKNTDDHLLIVSCVFHYEFEFIHPFSDGNGRVGRLWQNVILNNYKNIFGAIPIESVVRENQEAYYKALEDAGSVGESTPFIEFMLEVILNTVREVGNKVGNDLSDNQLLIIENIKINSKISASKLSEAIGISKRKIEENIAKLKAMNILKRVGGTRGHWEILSLTR